ncbi:chromate transporter [Blautia schinkii]|nr:chromate transporter [Blautia schinkii]
MSENSNESNLSSLTSAQVYWKLFTITLTLSACTFGGGFVIISMMKQKFVQKLQWLGDDEMLDMTAIAQSSPGALGVNIAIVVGYRLKRFWGAVVSTLGAVIPPLVIISIISVFYNQFKDNSVIAIALQVMRAGVAAVIFDVVIDLAKNIIKTKSVLWICLMIAAFVATCFFKVSAIIIILVCGLIGLAHVKAEDVKEGRR